MNVEPSSKIESWSWQWQWFAGIAFLLTGFVTSTMSRQSLPYQGTIKHGNLRFIFTLLFFLRILRNKIGSLPHLPTHFPSKQASLPTPPSSSSSAAMAYNSIYQVASFFVLPQCSSAQHLPAIPPFDESLDWLSDGCNLAAVVQKAIDLTVNIPSTFLTPPTLRQSRHQPRSRTTTTPRQRSLSPHRSPPGLSSRATLPAPGASSTSGLQAPLLPIFWDLSTVTTSTRPPRTSTTTCTSSHR